MSRYTQEEETQIVRMARNLTATIQAEKGELRKLKSQEFEEMPEPPEQQSLQEPSQIKPDYPPAPQAEYPAGKHIAPYMKEMLNRPLKLLLLFPPLWLLLLLDFFLSRSKKRDELSKQLADSDAAYKQACEEAEKLAAEKNETAAAEYKAEKQKMDADYAEKKEHYDTVTVPEYNKALSVWQDNQKTKIGLFESEIAINTEALNALYEETKIISSTYRELWILEWLYEDMRTSDHDIRYATELLDRDRQRLLTQEAGQITAHAIGEMTDAMETGFHAIYEAIDEGNALQEETISVLSKSRRDMNIGNIAATVQRHHTNEYLERIAGKRKK